MPKNNETCQQTGTYTGKCSPRGHNESIFIESGKTFPNCPSCGGSDAKNTSITWTWVRSTR